MFRESIKHLQMFQLNGKLVTFSDIGSGTPVLLSHGSFGGFDCGPIFFSRIAEQGFRIITPSRPGFMMTSLEFGRTPRAQADFFAEFLSARKIEKVVVFAHSGGTPAALQFARHYPEMTACISVLTPVVHAERFGMHPIVNRLVFNDYAMYISHLVSEVAPRVHAKLLCRSINIDHRYILQSEERMKTMQLAFGTAAPTQLRLAGLRNDLEQFTSLDLDFLPELKNRIQLLYSESDKRVPVTHGDYLKARIPHIEVHKYERGGHNPVMGSQSNTIVRTICDFIASCHIEARIV